MLHQPIAAGERVVGVADPGPDPPQHRVALVVLGLGWSAATVAGATMLTASLPPSRRVEAQGFTDALVSLVGALAAASAGLVMGGIDYLGVGLAYGGVTLLALLGLLTLARRDRIRPL